VVHLRPTEQAKARIRAKVKALTSRGWTWMDEYTRLTTLNATVRAWAAYYRYTSLLQDIEEITRYVWHRYLKWLKAKHKGSRAHELIQAKTAVLNGRTRWTAQIQQGNQTLRVYQWLPTRKELNRQRYRQKGKTGFPHPHLVADAVAEDFPMGETGPEERIYSATIGVSSARPPRHEPLEMSELKLRAKMRDHFRCVRCGATDDLRVHHIKGTKSHRLEDLETLCLRCHQAEHGYRRKD
jgi:RNA-directed DNA polymerase